MFCFIAPSDFTRVSGTLTVSDSSTSQCVTITVVDDDEDEDTRECFALVMSTSSFSSVSLKPAQATICIFDNGGKEYKT